MHRQVRVSAIARLFSVCLLLISPAPTIAADDSLVVLAHRLGSAEPPDFRRIRMIDAARGWTVGEGIWLTNDGARTWQRVPASDGDRGLDASNWGVVPTGQLWVVVSERPQGFADYLEWIENNGAARRLTLPCGQHGDCLETAIAFSPKGGIGLLAALSNEQGQRRIRAFKTLDRGRTWTEESALGIPVETRNLAVSFVDDSRVALTTDCAVYISPDTGGAWHESTYSGLDDIVCGEDASPITVRFTPAGIGWLRTGDGWVMQTKDRGESWFLSPLGRKPRNFPLTLDEWISFGDGARGLAVLGGTVFASRNAGETSDRVASADRHFFSVSCVATRCVLVSATETVEYTFGN